MIRSIGYAMLVVLCLSAPAAAEKLVVKKGATSKLVEVFIPDSSSATGAGLTGLVYNASGLTAYYYRSGAGTATAITLATMTLGTWASGGFVALDGTNMPGWYQVGIPNAAIDTGANTVAIHLKGATNMVPVPLEIQLVDYDPQDSVRLGMTSLPNVAAGANNGLPLGDASGDVTLAATTHTGAVIPTVTTLTNLPSIPANWLTAAGINAGALDGKGNWNIGKTGYELSANGVDLIWDEPQAGHVTAGTYGLYLDAQLTLRTLASASYSTLVATDNIGINWADVSNPTSTVGLTNTTVGTLTTYTGNTPQTGDSYARLGTPAGASVSADVAAVKAETATILADTNDLQTRTPATLVGGRMDANVGAISADAAAADNLENVFDGTRTYAFIGDAAFDLPLTILTESAYTITDGDQTSPDIITADDQWNWHVISAYDATTKALKVSSVILDSIAASNTFITSRDISGFTVIGDLYSLTPITSAIQTSTTCDISASTSGTSFTIASCASAQAETITLASGMFEGVLMEAYTNGTTACNVAGQRVLVQDQTTGVVTVFAQINAANLISGFTAAPNTSNCGVKF